MKDLFAGFYPPTEKEYEKLSKEALVVFDTNSLLDLYRLPAKARDELLAVLEGLKDRLWIPFQVALEFQRKRLTVIADERKVTQDALDSTKGLVQELTKRVEALELDQHNLGLKPEELLKDLDASSEKLTDALTAVHESRQNPGHADEIRDRLDVILGGKVGSPVASQVDYDAIIADGEDRFSNRIPPGFADADKQKDPNKAFFFHNGIKYTSKFGDLVLWRQLIAHVKATKTKQVILITRDRKEDWWWAEKGKQLGPSPELVSEIRREAKVDLFWMYRPDQFLEMAKTYDIATVSSSSVDELKALKDRAEFRHVFETHITPRNAKPLTDSRMQDIVLAYLETHYEKVVVNQTGFPDAFSTDNNGRLAIEVIYTSKLSPSSIFERARSAITIGNDLIAKKDYDQFMLVCALLPEQADHFYRTDEQKQNFGDNIQDLIKDAFGVRVLVGEIKSELFQPLTLFR